MTCFIAQNELSALADDALEMARAAELQEHLSGCANCTRELQEIRRIRTLMRALPIQRAPADFLSKVTAKAQRKSLLERASAALAPVLQLPRPAQASLALAASLVVAVTVFWNNPDRGLSNLRSAPGAEGFREVANVQPAPTAVSALEAPADNKQERNFADAERQEKTIESDRPQANEKLAKAITSEPAPPPALLDEPKRVADKGAADRLEGRASEPQQTPVTELALRAAQTPAPLAGASGNLSSSGRGAGGAATGSVATGGSAYSAPTSAGLYASDPGAAAGTPARVKADAAKPQAAAPAKDVSGAIAQDEDSRTEPSFDSSSFGQSATGGDDFASPDASVSPDPVEEKAKTRDPSGKKEAARRDRASAKAGEAGVAPAEPPAVESEVVATSPVASAAPAPVPTISAKYLSASAAAPAEIVSAAKAAGGRVVSPTSAPPGLGKAGASTVVTVEIPASGVAGFEEALRLGGTLERGALPAGAVRFRIEVVRQ
jgi:hypothetical protein